MTQSLSDRTPPKKPVSSKVVYQNPWITVREDTTIAFDGSTGIYGYIEAYDSVKIIALNNDNEVYLALSFRYPSKSWGWELPGGGSDGEPLLDAAKRELEEEAGLLSNSWLHLGSHYVSNGFLTEQVAIFVARNVREEGVKETSTEIFADSGYFTIDQIDKLIAEGKINGSETISGLYLLKNWLAQQ